MRDCHDYIWSWFTRTLHLGGFIVGDLLGVLMGVKSNVGGVGIAMILLICIRLWMEKRGVMTVETEKAFHSGALCIFLLLLPWQHNKM